MDQQLSNLIRIAEKYRWPTREQRRELERAHVRLARADFYSETPTLEEIEQSFEYQGNIDADPPAAFDDPSVFNLDSMRSFAETLLPWTAEFAPPATKTDGYYWDNGQFSYTDAMALYAIVREYKPRVVLEIGSGFSSLVTAKALERNGSGKLVCIDPNPRTDIDKSGAVCIRRRVQDVSVDEIISYVGPRDLVFYDGSHAVKCGSDTVYFYLKVLPYLPSGVLVQSHDIRLPYAQPSGLLIDHKINWSEQYLLLAHLLNSDRYKSVFSSYMLHRRAPEVLEAMMHGRWPAGGASMWYEICGG